MYRDALAESSSSAGDTSTNVVSSLRPDLRPMPERHQIVGFPRGAVQHEERHVLTVHAVHDVRNQSVGVETSPRTDQLHAVFADDGGTCIFQPVLLGRASARRLRGIDGGFVRRRTT